MTDTADWEEVAIQRREDGSIDVDLYARRAMRLRAMAFDDHRKEFAGWISGSISRLVRGRETDERPLQSR